MESAAAESSSNQIKRNHDRGCTPSRNHREVTGTPLCRNDTCHVPSATWPRVPETERQGAMESAPVAAESSGTQIKRKHKEDKEFTYEKQADDEATLEEEEKLEQGDVKVRAVTPVRLRVSPSDVLAIGAWVGRRS